MVDIFDLYAKISLDSKGYTTGIDNASEKFKSFSSGVGSAMATVAKVTAAAVAAVAAASAALGKKLVSDASALAQYGDNIDKMSQKMGMSAEAYQEWDAVMQHSGTSIETMKASMKILANAAQTNNAAFKQLGITEKELKTLNQEQLFARTIEQLQKVDDTTQRTYLAGKLLGRGATELGALLNTSAEDTKKMKDRVHQLGGVMSNEAVKAAAKFQDNLQDMKTALSGLKRGIISDTIPAFNDLMDGFTKLMAGEEGAEEAIDKGVTKLETALGDIAPKIGELTQTLLPRVIKVAGSLISELAKSLPELITQIVPILFKAGADIVTNVGKGIFETLENTDLAGGAKTLTEKVNNMIAGVDAEKGGERFADVLNKILDAAFNVSATFNFKDLATKLTDFCNNALQNINWERLGQTVSNLWKGVWDFIGTALGNIDWEGVGKSISEFINGIDWWGILDSMFNAIGEIVKNAPKFIEGVIRNIDFQNAAGLVAVLFAPKIASSLLSTFKTDTSVGQNLTACGNSIGSYITAGAKAFLAGWAIGTWIYNTWKDEIDEAFERLADEVKDEAETVKTNLENTIKQAKTDVYANAENREFMEWASKTINSEGMSGLQKVAEEYGEKYGTSGGGGHFEVTMPELKKVPKTTKKTTGWTVDLAGSTTNKQTGSSGFDVSQYMPKTTNIYLDTGALVGGTSAAKAQQTNYTSRGYAQ